MERHPCDINPALLLGGSMLSNVKWKADRNGILMANGQWRGVPTWIMNALDPYFQILCHRIGPRTLCHVMVNTLPPGTSSGIHVDPSPEGIHFQRWHLPLETNPQAKFWQEGMEKPEHLEFGWWHGPVEYWKRHIVRNDGEQSRTHLIVDVLP